MMICHFNSPTIPTSPLHGPRVMINKESIRIHNNIMVGVFTEMVRKYSFSVWVFMIGGGGGVVGNHFSKFYA